MPDQDQATDLAHGATVYDETTGQLGTVADTRLSPGWVYVRPVGGGIEWKARREDLRKVTTGDALAEQLRTARTGEAR